MPEANLLGRMTPLGGGDPIPLKKKELIIGRRPSCDIRLDFENISGRHCALTFVNGTWHVRDLGSTNGTKVNGQKLQREQGILPDDELAIASHLFHIDYEPSSPMIDAQQLLEDEEALREADARKQTSLMELAGFSDENRPNSRPRPRAEERPRPLPARHEPAAASLEEPLADVGQPRSDPEPLKDDDFFRLIEDEVAPKRD